MQSKFNKKAVIICLIKERLPEKIILAIGDGTIDVDIILKAYCGVGVLGKEGMQAAILPDYAIEDFKFLKFLLFLMVVKLTEEILMLC